MSETTDKFEEQEVAEAEVESFRKDLGPFVVAAETTRMAMVFTEAKEPNHPIVFANDSFLSLTGYAREELLGQNFKFLMTRGTDPEALAQVDAAFDGSSRKDPEVHYRRMDGIDFWATTFVNPVRDESGAVVQHFISLVDLTEHKQEQARSKMLIDELNHRVKNTLSTVQSIVGQALRTNTDAKAIRDSIESRLFALSRSHDLLTRENWEGAGLLDLVKGAVEPFRVANGRPDRFQITGENIRLPPKATLALGIALNELAANAVKSGALSTEAGSVLIDWRIEPAPEVDRLILHWREKDGPPVTPPSEKGIGSRVIERGLVHELQGTVNLDFRAEGVVCTIDFPAPRGADEG
jgi:PAS domain S-box-containing protein